MSFLCKQLFKNKNINKCSTRSLFHWINIQFNAVDEDRRKDFGPDRTCAEWILRNGGSVKFTKNGAPMADYNELPNEEIPLKLEEIHAINCSIMKNGFKHLDGCNYIKKIIFHQCNYLEDEALKDLMYVEKTLTHLQISNCGNITEKGLLYVHSLRNLKEFLFYDLPGVKDKDKLVQALKSNLPQTHISFK
ncbi:ATP synthase subunit s, mitochondrial isoform X1 [Aethina tumida]|uniref:ATP synthase subunit s, mitochondrial isoform X1 n=1 Tax=Aethina tumida TaxID=116153 RepID=UPI00096B3E3D|nr:ATP synthase subunit s, mitochondrial isoform X1 [Aethina tumida]